MRSMICLIVLFVTQLVSGCAKTVEPPAPVRGPDFCVVEEVRRFTQEEIDWRAEHAPWNLRKDLKTNATWKAECPKVVSSE